MITKLQSLKSAGLMLALLLPAISVQAQAVTGAAGNNTLTLILSGIILFSLLWTVMVIRKAVVVLKENGQEVDFLSSNFFRALTFSPVLITTSIVILVIIAIYLAINY